jgi:hypothetical protein
VLALLIVKAKQKYVGFEVPTAVIIKEFYIPGYNDI